MGLKLKFLINILVVLFVFGAFHPIKETSEDYIWSLIALAFGMTFLEQFAIDRWQARGESSQQKNSDAGFNIAGAVLSLIAAGVLAFIVPAIHRNNEQREVESQKATQESADERRRMMSDPKVQRALKIIQEMEDRRKNSPASSQPAANQDSQATHPGG